MGILGAGRILSRSGVAHGRGNKLRVAFEIRGTVNNVLDLVCYCLGERQRRPGRSLNQHRHLALVLIGSKPEAELRPENAEDGKKEQVSRQQHQHGTAQPPPGETLHQPHRQRRRRPRGPLVPRNIFKGQRPAQEAPVSILKLQEVPVERSGEAVVVFVLFAFLVPAGGQHRGQRERHE